MTGAVRGPRAEPPVRIRPEAGEGRVEGCRVRRRCVRDERDDDGLEPACTGRCGDLVAPRTPARDEDDRGPCLVRDVGAVVRGDRLLRGGGQAGPGRVVAVGRLS
ncbi:hypothetical protein GCM10009706_27900 [Curtobacterium citreum]|nr:hypothetical protein GCM10009706_27900 [Curtobacterium citreum]